MSTTPRFTTADIEKTMQPQSATSADHAEVDAAAIREEAASRAEDEAAAPLFAEEAAEGFRRRWDAIQAGFVDDPRRAVEEADALVGETIEGLANSFTQARARLEQHWGRSKEHMDGSTQSVDRSNNASTEALRLALRHYRSFFKRLLTV